MSGNNQNPNKDRSTNFTKDETNKLMLLLKDYSVIISKKTDHASNQQKEAAWRLLTEKFNSDATRYRSIKQLQQKYNNMKKTARKEMAVEKYGRRQTGGGPSPPKPSETTEWLNSIMGESITGLPAVYDSDALDDTLLNMVPADLDTTANVTLTNKLDEECITQVTVINTDTLFSESEDAFKENVSNNIDIPKSNEFDSSTPKAMLRQPVSKELSFINKKRKTAYTPLETRKRIIMHVDKKNNFLAQKQRRENDLAQYAKEQHDLNIKNTQELHELELDFKKKMYNLLLEKCKHETEKAKFDLDKISQS